MIKKRQQLIIKTRGVHGSVRFGLDPKNQPNRITVFLLKINRIGSETGSNRTGPVRLNPVFWGKNREKSDLEVSFLPTLEFFFFTLMTTMNLDQESTTHCKEMKASTSGHVCLVIDSLSKCLKIFAACSACGRTLPNATQDWSPHLFLDQEPVCFGLHSIITRKPDEAQQ